MSARFTDGSGLSMTNVHCRPSAPKTKPKPMRPYEPFYSARSATLPKEYPPGVLDHRTGKFYERPDYTDIELGSLARWLNDRAEGYTDES